MIIHMVSLQDKWYCNQQTTRKTIHNSINHTRMTFDLLRRMPYVPTRTSAHEWLGGVRPTSRPGITTSLYLFYQHRHLETHVTVELLELHQVDMAPPTTHPPVVLFGYDCKHVPVDHIVIFLLTNPSKPLHKQSAIGTAH